MTYVALALLALAHAAPPVSIPVISIVDRTPVDGVKMVIGEIQKSPRNPLFVQDKPWEPRLDNGYPNVVYDPKNSEGLGVWRCFYGDCVKGCGSQILLYANSSDGYTWEKPNLGIFDVKEVRPDLAKYGKENNIIMKGGGLGIYHDLHEANASRRFKCFGDGCGGVKGTAVSADGFTWTDQRKVDWPSPQRYDCHNQVLYVPEQRAYIATTRDGFSGATGRTIGITKSEENKFEFETKTAPVMVEKGDAANQLYSQITWQWHNVFLGIVMVYDAQSSAGEVHCRLAWSPSSDALSGWNWVDEGGLTGRDFIPLGRGVPVPKPCEWESVKKADGKTQISDCDAYRQGSQPQHTICAKKSGYVSLDLSACKAACAADASCQVIEWQGLQKNNFSDSKPGQCFLVSNDCTSQESYSSKLAKTFCMDIERCTRKDAQTSESSSSDFDPARRDGVLGDVSGNDFDSHVCFAASRPVPTASGERIYYMGGNGPHSGSRNSSFALATLRTDGYAGMKGTGTFITRKVKVTGSKLLVTADVSSPSGSVALGLGVSGLTLDDSTAVTSSVTNKPITFKKGMDLSHLVGQEVALHIRLDNAIIYTVSFADNDAASLYV